MKTTDIPYRFRHGGYVSEYETFLKGFLGGHPRVEPDQLHGWYLLWDRRVDLNELEKERKDTVPPEPYYYP